MSNQPFYLVIYGETLSGQRFRPSDWAERLAGVLAPYGPVGGSANRIAYSPYAVPRSIKGVTCVVIDERLRGIEPLAWKFAHDFANDNQLKTAYGSQELLTAVNTGFPA